MKIFKCLLCLCVGVSINVSLLNAKDIQTSHDRLSKEEAQILFGTQNVDVAVLSKQEMGETKGQFWLALLGAAGIGAGTYLLNGLLNNKWDKFEMKLPGISF